MSIKMTAVVAAAAGVLGDLFHQIARAFEELAAVLEQPEPVVEVPVEPEPVVEISVEPEIPPTTPPVPPVDS